MITISGLTPKQKALISVMWDLDTMDRVRAFISTLPTRDQLDAQALLEIAIWESIEQQEGLEDYAQTARDLISHCSRK